MCVVLIYHTNYDKRYCQTIEPVFAQLNGNRKRMINTKYIISQVMKLANFSPAKIPITKWKTWHKYKKYWD